MKSISLFFENGLTDKLRNSSRLRQLKLFLEDKYIGYTVFIAIVLTSIGTEDGIFFGLLPDGLDNTVSIIVHIPVFVFFSIITAKLIRKYSSDMKDRAVFLALTLGSLCMFSSRIDLLIDYLAILLIYLIFYLVYNKKIDFIIPLLLFVVIAIRPLLVIPVVTYMVFIFRYLDSTEYKEVKNIKSILIASAVATAAALVLSALFVGGFIGFIRLFAPDITGIKFFLRNTPKLSIVFIVLSVSIFGNGNYPKKAIKAVMISTVLSSVFYILNNQRNGILMSFLVLQSLILLGISRKNLIRFITEDTDKKRKPCMIFASIIVLGQFLFSLDFYSGDYGSVEFRITPFYICYQDLGFVQRALWGTIYRFLFGGYIPGKVFFLSYHTIYILLYALLSLMIVLMVRKSANKTEHAFAFALAILYFISPGFDKMFLEASNYILAWACVWLAYKNRSAIMLAPLLCVLAMLTHQIFASIIFPIVFIALVYRAFINSGGHSARNISCLVITLLLVGVCFVYLTYFNPGNLDMTYEQFCDMVGEHTDGFFTPHGHLVKYVYLDKDHVHSSLFHSKIQGRQVWNAILVFIVNLPGLAVYLYPFLHSAKLESGKIRKLAYLASVLSVLAIAPSFLIETDYGRWCSQYITLLILAPLILTLFQPEDKKWYKDLSRKQLYIVGAIWFISVLIQPNYPQLMYRYSLVVLV